MRSIEQLVTFTTEIEHDLEHDLTQKKLYSIPKINNAKGDLSKRWYVYFSFRNPATGKMKRSSNIYGITNTFKTKEDRMAVLSTYRKRLLHLLKQGYNPFEDNTALHDKIQQSTHPSQTPVKVKVPSHKIPELNEDTSGKEKIASDQQKLQQLIEDLKGVVATVKDTSLQASLQSKVNFEIENKNAFLEKTKSNASSKKETTKEVEKEEKGMIFTDAFEFALGLKAKEVSGVTINQYRGKAKRFKTWLKNERPEKKFIHQLKRMDLLDFLNYILLETSPRSRNNYKTELSSLFQVLKNNEFVAENYLKSIPLLKTKPEKHKRYTVQQLQEVFSYLEKEDPVLLLYIQFIYYGFMRPVEISRLRVKDVDIENRTIQFQSKTAKLKTKIIPEILLKNLPDLSKLNENSWLFTATKLGDDWHATEVNRREHFTKRFGKVVKNQFELKENYGLYSFRHTAITKLYNELKKELTEYEAKSKLMPITGHITMVSLEKYLRDIDADLPEDYSDLFKTEKI